LICKFAGEAVSELGYIFAQCESAAAALEILVRCLLRGLRACAIAPYCCWVLLSAASRHHRIPLATVSRRVAELEEHLNVRLLHRGSRKVVLTDAPIEVDGGATINKYAATRRNWKRRTFRD